MKISSLAERQIKKAQAEGQFDNLKGAGKPLDMQDGDFTTDAVGFRIMAEAGALPREIQLRKSIEAQAEVVKSALTAHDRKRETARLNDLQLRLDIEQEARRRFQGD